MVNNIPPLGTLIIVHFILHIEISALHLPYLHNAYRIDYYKCTIDSSIIQARIHIPQHTIFFLSIKQCTSIVIKYTFSSTYEAHLRELLSPHIAQIAQLCAHTIFSYLYTLIKDVQQITIRNLKLLHSHALNLMHRVHTSIPKHL